MDQGQHRASSPSEMPRESTFCNATITDDDLIEVPDAKLDPRFATLTDVRIGGLRFYAGAPIRLVGG